VKKEPPKEQNTLQRLQSTIEQAMRVVRELSGNEQLGRLLEAFRAMPAEDRPAVIEAIEREVQARKLSLAAESMSGQSMVPNPHARLYLRAHESGFDRNALERDEMMIATVRGLRAATLIPAVPEIHASWRDATREALGYVDEPTRATVERLLHEVLGFLAEVRATEAHAPGESPATDPQETEAQGS
jgi:hypothetical protein